MGRVPPRDHRLRFTLGAQDDKIVNLVLIWKKSVVYFPCIDDCDGIVDLTEFYKVRGPPYAVKKKCSGQKKHSYSIKFSLR